VRIVSVIGRKNAGKTTLMVALAREYVRRGVRVMTIKHGHHPASADREGSDTWRHFHEGRAERTLIAGPEQMVLFARAKDEYDPLALAARYMAEADMVLCEGYKHAPLPKIEVWREAVGAPPLYDEAGPRAREWIALVVDELGVEAECPVFRFHDTNWLMTLANIAWERALVP
jgi:molybdopterin-guanine dinucleotide biosynthesis protein MobB